MLETLSQAAQPPAVSPMIEPLVAFGPYAFGAIIVLVLWKVVVVPERARADHQIEIQGKQMQALALFIAEQRDFNKIERDNLLHYTTANLDAMHAHGEAQTKALAAIVESLGCVVREAKSHTEGASR